MRKLLAILLISLLSLQASWAVAASYCAHEQGAAARHFGHHEHRHALHALHAAAPDGAASAGMMADPDTAAVAGLAGVDLDCSVCHAHALSGMPSVPFIAAMGPPPRPGIATVTSHLLSVLLPRPERPNWPAA